MATDRGSEMARGYAYAIIGSVAAGSVSSLGKILLRHNGPLVVTGLTFVISGLILLLYNPRVKPSRKSVPYLVFFGAIGAGLAPFMYTAGLDLTTAVNASLLANGEVLFTTVIAFSAFGERLSRGQVARGLLIIAGLVVVSTNLDLGHLQFLEGLAGNLLVVGATVAWALENNIMAVATRRFNVASISKFRNLIGGVAVTALALAVGASMRFTQYDFAVFLILGIAMAGATYFFVAAVKRLGAIRMLLVWSSSTVFGAFFAVLILGETITPVQVFGGALILSGVYIFHRGEAGPEAEPFTAPAGGGESALDPDSKQS